MPHHVQCAASHPPQPPENPFASDRCSAHCPSLRAGPIRRRTGRGATDKPPSPPGFPRAGEHAHTLHERSFRTLWLPHLQLDELRTRLRSANQILWLWLTIDPLTKIVPATRARPPQPNHGPSAHPRAPTEAGRRSRVPLFTSDGLNLYFYALTAHFGRWLALVVEDIPCAAGRWSQA